MQRLFAFELNNKPVFQHQIGSKSAITFHSVLNQRNRPLPFDT
jgi:hypothetical protein